MPIFAFVDAAAAFAAAPGVASAVGTTAPKAMTPATALVATAAFKEVRIKQLPFE
jgi:hypothetical protein